MPWISRHLSYANVVASLALFIAIGGASYAAVTLPTASVGKQQLKRGAVTSAKVRDHTLLKRDFRAGQLPRGPQGPAGPQGLQGPPGPAGPIGSLADGSVGTSALASGSVTNSKLATVVSDYTTDENVDSPKKVSLNCPPGTTILSGSGGVLKGFLPANAIAAISYDGPQPLQNGWAIQAYATSSNVPWSLTLSIRCVKN